MKLRTMNRVTWSVLTAALLIAPSAAAQDQDEADQAENARDDPPEPPERVPDVHSECADPVLVDAPPCHRHPVPQDVRDEPDRKENKQPEDDDESG